MLARKTPPLETPSPATASIIPTPRADLPARDLPPVPARLLHVRQAKRAGALTREEARLMRDLIRYAPLPLAELDPFQRAPGEWVIWTHDGEHPIAWWRAVYAEVMKRDR